SISPWYFPWAQLGAQARQHVLADLEIGVHVLHVIAVFEGFEQLEQPRRGIFVEHRGGFRAPAEPCRSGGPETLLQRVAHAVEILRRRDHDMPVCIALDIASPGLDRRFEHLVSAGRSGRVGDLADMVEHEADAARLAEGAGCLGEGGAHLAGGAVAVIGQGLDDDRHPARPIALVAHFFIGIPALAAGAALNRALDGVLRHVGLARRQHSGAQPRVGVGVGQARTRRGGQFPDDLGEDLGALFVLRALPVHDVFELRMAGHFRRSPQSRPNKPIWQDWGGSGARPASSLSGNGTYSASRPPTRTGSMRRASPVASSIATKTPHRLASPSAGFGFSPGSLVTKRRTDGALSLPITES